MNYATSFIAAIAVLWVLAAILKSTGWNPLGLFALVFFVLLPVAWLIVVFA